MLLDDHQIAQDDLAARRRTSRAHRRDHRGEAHLDDARTDAEHDDRPSDSRIVDEGTATDSGRHSERYVGPAAAGRRREWLRSPKARAIAAAIPHAVAPSIELRVAGRSTVMITAAEAVDDGARRSPPASLVARRPLSSLGRRFHRLDAGQRPEGARSCWIAPRNYSSEHLARDLAVLLGVALGVWLTNAGDVDLIDISVMPQLRGRAGW
jgi:hypothetical protein